jgi:AraC-like DNA-binding protein
MAVKICVRLFLFLSLTGTIWAVKDTVLPEGKLIDPLPFSVISNNVIQFSAEASDSQSGIREIRYFGSYFTMIDSNESPITLKGYLSYRFLGKADKPPYTFFWDCSNIPDQDNWRMSFYCDIEDKAGNVAQKTGGIRHYIVLDRNPRPSPQTWQSSWFSGRLKIDGSFEEWPATDTLRFSNGNNKIWAISVWNEKEIAFGIFTADFQLNKPPHDTLPYWWYDCIEIYMDMKMDRSSHRRLDDRQLDIGVADTMNGNIVEFEKGVNQRWREGVTCKVQSFGTINRNLDTDSGFVIEVAYAWKNLGFNPKPGKSFGFDIFNDDNDFGDIVRMGKGWSGTERYNNNNPSEWGTLILTRTGSRLLSFRRWLILIALLGVIVILFFHKRFKPVSGPGPAPQKPTRAEQVAGRITGFLNANYSNPDLSLGEAAGALKISDSHLRHTLKIVTGQSFSDYLSQVRINKARSLLKERQDLNITEISIECGFKSLEYFIQVFKKYTNGLSPSVYRQNLLKKP